MKRFLILTICIGVLAVVANAQDQVIVINDEPKTIKDTDINQIVGLADATLSLDRAKQLITLLSSELGLDLKPDKPDFYCILHLLRWNEGKRGVKAQNWYVYHSGAWSKEQFQGTRIYGKKELAVLYLHLNALEDTGQNEISYRVEVTKKLPAPVQSLFDLIKSVGASALTAPKRVNYIGGKLITIDHVPSDVTVRALVAADEPSSPLQEVGKQTYDNEGRYYWDVSVGLPVTKIKELEFNAQDGTVRAKEIDKQKLFAFFNFYFKPIDTKGTKPQLWPHPIVGLALSKKPLDRIFVGGGMGLNKVEFFAGVAFNKTLSPSTLAPGSAATQSQVESDLKPKYQPKFVVGLNIPVRQILDKLKAK